MARFYYGHFGFFFISIIYLFKFSLFLPLNSWSWTLCTCFENYKKRFDITLLKCFYFLAFTFNTYYLYIFKLIIMNLSKYADLSWLSFEELVLIHYLFVCLQIDSTSILFCLFADQSFPDNLLMFPIIFWCSWW